MSRILTIGSRTGSFPGMQKDRQFMVVIVRPGHGTEMDMTVQPDQIVRYSGDLKTVHLSTPTN